MIINSLIKHQKKTAWALLFIFYAEMVFAAGQQKEIVYQYAFSAGLKEKSSFLEQQRFPLPDNFLNENETITDYDAEKMNEALESNSRAVKAPQKVNIGGPGQPEMQGFQSVNANNMVDLFSGDFSYNIPLLDVGGYPLGISYRSGATMDQEASWVGLGWNINPGTISRNVRGLPDDFDGTEKITKQYNIRKNWTAGITASARPEIFGIDIPKIGLNVGAFYNNYCGIGFELGASATVNFKNLVTTKTTDPKTGAVTYDTTQVTKNTGGSLAFSLNSQQGLSIDASLMRKFGNEESKYNGSGKISASYNSRSGLKDLSLSGEFYNNKQMKANQNFSYTADLSFAKTSYTPTITMPFTSLGFSLSIKGGGALFGFHPLGALRGYYSSQYISAGDKIDSLPAYGYMHFQKGNRDERALLDFNREKDVMFREKTPHTAIPFYTYDTYSITGEGIGGSFRPYRGDVGYIRDHKLKTKSLSGGVGIDLGGGPNLAHFGGNLNFNLSALTNTRWYAGNLIEKNVRFMTADSLYEPVYFRNPAEQTSNTQEYYDKIGGDDVVRVGMAGGSMEPVATNQLIRYDKQKFKGAVTVTSPIIKNKRDKRSQVISYLNAEEAERVGLDPVIKSYPVNTFPKGACDENYESIKRNDGEYGIRKPHHISEVDVLNTDGRRYIYGIPAYNLSQKEVTFAVNANGDVNTGLVGYGSGDNSPDNSKGKDNFFSSEITPAFAHSFLLTGVLSPDYVDVTGNGVSEDDRGDAVKFNYTRMRWGSPGLATTAFKWRVPYDSYKASYNEGLKTDKNDDKGNYVYGEKEVWYMNSIESKNMIALFILDSGYRQDDISVLGENGGQASSDYALKRLKQIKLYAKSDYFKNPAKARPIKTVNFAYSYKLCVGSPTALSTKGKLTLDSLWFTYNGNGRSAKNKYRFTYNANNPDFSNKSSDRWGNYKPVSDNPVATPTLTNSDYPYATQVKANADANAGAWNLTQIKLPSGAKINAEYESDDYAYVQDKRAMNMFKICGMGLSNDYALAKPLLYDNSQKPGLLDNLIDCRYVFIKVTSPVTSKDEIYHKYLEGIEKLYFKIAVKIPGVSGANAYETVPFYAEPEPGEYGAINANLIWVKLKEFGSNQCFPAIAAIQFLRLNLPGKAYPGSDNMGDNDGPAPAIKAVLGMGAQFKDALIGFSKAKRQGSVCQQFDTSRSFIRLNNPDYYKYGGGYRIKKVVIADNWTSMTGQKESYYGQEYDYSTTKQIFYEEDGSKKTKTIKISSGVASYEPNVGNEENPFRQPIEYQESVTLAPTDYFYSEYPYCEALFPSPSVGYSKVTVSSINKRNLKSFNGWEESEFYTSYDFPTVTDFTTFDGESKKTGKRKYSVINSLSMKRTTISQGFKIDLNDMTGKVKSQKSYAATDSAHPIAYTINYYRTSQDNIHGTYLSNVVPVMDSANGIINPGGTVGKDIELMMDFREQTSLNTGLDVNLNAETMAFGFIVVVLPPFFPVTSIDDSRFRSAATVKVIQRYGILDSVLHYEKGSLVSTQNVVYDAETGEALLSRTQNEFNDPVYNFSYPSHWAYSGMGQAYKNIDVSYSGITFRKGILENPALQHVNMKLFESGDEIYVYTASPNGAFPDACGTSTCWIPKNPANRIWAINTNKNNGGGADMFVFMDAQGNPYEAENVYMRIIRSGHRNMLGSAVATITSLADPRKTRIVSGGRTEQYVEFTDTTKVLNTTAASFKDIWKLDDRLYTKQIIDTSDTLYHHPPGYMVCRGNRIEEYARCGTFIYDPVYDVCGVTFTGDTIPKSNPFWHSQTSADCMPFHYSSCTSFSLMRPTSSDTFSNQNNFRESSSSTDDNSCKPSDYTAGHPFDTTGPLNRCGIWACCGVDSINSDLPGFIGFSYPITVPFTKRYYIGLGADNEYRFKLDGRPIRKTAGDDEVTNFYLWHIYPVELTAGRHIIEMEGLNNGDRVAFGAEVYNNTKEDLINATSYNDLDLIFSTKDLIGTHFQTGVFTCDSSYALYTPDGDTLHYQCIKLTDTCVSRFTQPYINPYVEGFYGNWRMDTSFVYYGTRKETLATNPMDIRRAGTITGYQTFWNFANPASADPVKARYISRNQTASAIKVWSWNSTVNQYNAKGFEEETKDPLGRYTAGLYGYKRQLPVAVTNNSRYMEAMFDGFEDYNYEVRCTFGECPAKRHADFGDVLSRLSTEEKHTGKNSLKILSNDSAVLRGNVIRQGEADTVYGFSINAPLQSCDSPVYSVSKYEGTGFVCTGGLCSGKNLAGRYEGNDGGGPSESDPNDRYWTGYLIPESTGGYLFHTVQDDESSIEIYEIPSVGVPIHVASFSFSGGSHTLSANLTRGKIYSIHVGLRNTNTAFFIELKWKTPPMQCAGMEYDFIPPKYIYATLTDAQAHTSSSSSPVSYYSLNSTNTTGYALNRKFTLLQGDTMILGAWVKEEQDCKAGSYQNNSINIYFDGALTKTFEPTGYIIEGWQRYEAEFTVPASAHNFFISFKSNSGISYFDDIRMHPFNANEKSFVYNSTNLRLMAELDENNYASFYEYDEEGTLTRVKKETQRGIKTIQETKSTLTNK